MLRMLGDPTKAGLYDRTAPLTAWLVYGAIDDQHGLTPPLWDAHLQWPANG